MQQRDEFRPSPRARATPQSEPLSASATAAATEASRDAAVSAASSNATSAPLSCICLCPSTGMRRATSGGVEPPATAGAGARPPRPASSTVAMAAAPLPPSHVRRGAAAWAGAAAAPPPPDADSSQPLSWPSADKDWLYDLVAYDHSVSLEDAARLTRCTSSDAALRPSRSSTDDIDFMYSAEAYGLCSLGEADEGADEGADKAN